MDEMGVRIKSITGVSDFFEAGDEIVSVDSIRVADQLDLIFNLPEQGNVEFLIRKQDGRDVSKRIETVEFERAGIVLEEMEFHWLVIWVVSRNDGAHSFYERHGLRADGATRYDRFDGHGVLVVRLAKMLNAAVDFDEIDRRLRAPRVPSRG